MTVIRESLQSQNEPSTRTFHPRHRKFHDWRQ